MSTWQPIETAPRDGTSILVIQAGEFKPGVPYESTVVAWSSVDDFEGWLSCEDCGPVNPRDWALTHWMPLPEPPADFALHGDGK